MNSLSQNQLSDLANIIAIFIPLALSAVFGGYFREKYFLYWSLSLASGLVTLGIDFYTADAGHPVILTSIACLAYLVFNYFVVRAAGELANRLVWAHWYARLGGLTWFVYFVGSLAGLPFEKAFAPGLLESIGAYFLLAWAIFQSSRGERGPRALLSSVVACNGLIVLLYPILISTSYLWIGFLTAALIHLFSGVAMLAFTLSEVAIKLDHQNTELRKLDKLQTEFLGNLNHELRTPFQAIKTALYLLGSTSNFGQQRETLAILTTNVDRLFALITDLIDVSRLAQDAMTYEMLANDINEIIERSVQSLRGLFEDKQIGLILDLPPERAYAEVDGQRLQQVIVNLLSNAQKFTPPGGIVTVRLRAERTDARLEVTDTGVGIPSDQLERIFQRFYQVDGAKARKHGGSGLGLTICRAIVEQGHGGKIWAECDGSGAKFTVLLPLEQRARQSQRPLMA